MREGPAVYIIVGPTASGKSGLAVALAQHLEGVVINADSMQVYESLSIVTARPSKEDRSKIPHRLYGIVSDPNDSYSVARWREAAVQEIEKAFQIGKEPIIVGGTGLYIKALLEGLTNIPESDPQMRETLRQQAQSPEGIQELYESLKQKDHVAAGHLKATDAQRIVRALEVVMTTGKPLHEWQAIPTIPLPYKTKVIYLNPPREEVVVRSQKRLERMFKDGAIEEVRALLKSGLYDQSPLRKAVGVREINSYLKGELTLKKALEKSFIATRQYIKRQQTWFNHQLKPDIILTKCYEPSDFQPLLKEL